MQVQSVQLRVSLTGRYATALYKEASSTKNVDTILRDINAFKKLLEDHHDLEKLLKSQLLHANSAIGIIEEIGKIMNYSKLFIDFLKVVTTNRRCAYLQNIFKDFLTMVDAKSKTVAVLIEIAKINKNHLDTIEDLLKEMHPTQSHRFEYTQVPELLGGFRAFISERCLDYSLRSRLNRLSYQLKEA